MDGQQSEDNIRCIRSNRPIAMGRAKRAFDRRVSSARATNRWLGHLCFVEVIKVLPADIPSFSRSSSDVSSKPE
jgi:hypothetical protein